MKTDSQGTFLMIINRSAVTVLLAVAAVGLFAQGVGPISNNWRKYTKPYAVRAAPPLSLSDAYSLSQAFMGDATNRFYCVSASCLEPTKAGLPGWSFAYYNANGQRVGVEVYFDKDANTDNPALLHGK
jgi:hypothetical protein